MIQYCVIKTNTNTHNNESKRTLQVYGLEREHMLIVSAINSIEKRKLVSQVCIDRKSKQIQREATLVHPKISSISYSPS